MISSLSDAGVAVLDCEHKTPSAQERGHPYIAIPDIQDGRVVLETTRRISGDDLAEWTRRTVPRAGDVVVTRRGRVGDSAPIPDVQCAIGQNLVLLRSDGRNVDQDYLRWAVRSPEWWGEVERLRNVGAVFSSLNVKDIARIRLTLPPLREQQAIAEVLGALDDKIAANTAAAVTAGSVAAAEFSRASVGASRVGQTFADVAEISGGATPSTKREEFWNGSIEWATPTDMTALAGPYLSATSRTITELGLASCSSKLIKPGAILMTSRATIGALAVNTVPTAVNQGFIVVEPNEARKRWWLFHQMKARVDEFISWANGATFPELSRGTFKRLPVWHVSDDVIHAFDDKADSLHGLAGAALAENRTLAATRDALLPQLMSGKLRVRDAETLAAEAGA